MPYRPPGLVLETRLLLKHPQLATLNLIVYDQRRRAIEALEARAPPVLRLWS